MSEQRSSISRDPALSVGSYTGGAADPAPALSALHARAHRTTRAHRPHCTGRCWSGARTQRPAHTRPPDYMCSPPALRGGGADPAPALSALHARAHWTACAHRPHYAGAEMVLLQKKNEEGW